MPQLLLELIPKTCHYKNARKKLTATEWNKLRKYIYNRANNICEICSLTGKEQGYRNNLECHEIWEFNKKTLTQKLIGLIALCPLCHQSKHFGRSIRMGKKKQILAHIRKINKWTLKTTLQHIKKAYTECNERSKYYWKLDLLILKEDEYSSVIKLKKTNPSSPTSDQIKCSTKHSNPKLAKK